MPIRDNTSYARLRVKSSDKDSLRSDYAENSLSATCRALINTSKLLPLILEEDNCIVPVIQIQNCMNLLNLLC